MKIKKIISAVLLCTVFASCSNNAPYHEIPLDISSGCPVSTMRTGTERQGIKTLANSFECTQEGAYFMSQGVEFGRWLLYSDHGSDNVIKLCGRPDCAHNNKECNAYFDGAVSVSYYNGSLYTYDIYSRDLIRINLDGTERTTVYNVSSFLGKNEIKRTYKQTIINGVFFITGSKLNDMGEEVMSTAYYKLDSSMNEPKIDPSLTLYIYADGEKFICPIESNDPEKEQYIITLWDPDKGVVDELFTADKISGSGYYGTKAHYYVENGVIIEDSYTEGKKELFDTGLKGEYRLVCLPDCMVVSEKAREYKEKMLLFYDWDLNSLGSMKLDYDFDESIFGPICGETPERIFLTDNNMLTPRYYINKSDFGTGNIEIHPLNMPDGFPFYGETENEL